MDLIVKNGYNLNSLKKINIILGKNGCGKSTLLKKVEESLKRDKRGEVRYLSPERGGALKYNPSVVRNISNDDKWLSNDRRKNQAAQFREQSLAQYRKLELLSLREMETNVKHGKDVSDTFEDKINQLNELLDNIEIRRDDSDFTIHEKSSGEIIKSDSISSGESELISLGIECLVFEKDCVTGGENILFMDEPDLHLHPDLQTRFASFLQNLVEYGNFKVIIATHSTAFLGALQDYSETAIAFMLRGDTDIEFKEVNDVLRKVLPVFGAHPLSNVFNQAPVLLVEGEDDERVWQQAIRTSEGNIRIYPCAVGGIDELSDYERQVNRIVSSVYDNAISYSIRDRDGTQEEITDLPPTIRFRLNCRSAENLLLTDEVLDRLGINWDKLEPKIGDWIKNNPDHPHYDIMNSFSEEGFDRMNSDLKDIRNDLMGIIGSNKPWEIAVGQSIGQLRKPCHISEYSLANFLGKKLVEHIIP